jgi:Nucleotidyl transferase AbiEii toxin, Type IV TA system
MPISKLHREVAAIALGAASEHGFALGGGNALIAHGVIDRTTQDVDLFTDEEHGVEAAADAVEAALQAAGFETEREDKTVGIADLFEGMGEGLAEWTVTAPGGQRYTPAELIGLARRLDPGLTDRDFADAGRRLDEVGDGWFASLGLGPGEIAAVRERFEAWPRPEAGE